MVLRLSPNSSRSCCFRFHGHPPKRINMANIVYLTSQVMIECCEKLHVGSMDKLKTGYDKYVLFQLLFLALQMPIFEGKCGGLIAVVWCLGSRSLRWICANASPPSSRPTRGRQRRNGSATSSSTAFKCSSGPTTRNMNSCVSYFTCLGTQSLPPPKSFPNINNHQMFFSDQLQTFQTRNP